MTLLNAQMIGSLRKKGHCVIGGSFHTGGSRGRPDGRRGRAALPDVAREVKGYLTGLGVPQPEVQISYGTSMVRLGPETHAYLKGIARTSRGY